jgi:hypothetical protein
MQNHIHLAWDIYVFSDIMFAEAESFILKQVLDVIKRTGDKIIHANDMVALGDKIITQMASDKTCAAGNNYYHI